MTRTAKPPKPVLRTHGARLFALCQTLRAGLDFILCDAGLPDDALHRLAREASAVLKRWVSWSRLPGDEFLFTTSPRGKS